MLSNSSHIHVPDWFSQMCKLNLHNTKKSYTDMADLIQSTPFLKLYVSEVFSDYLKKGSMLSMLTALGWEGIRNRLAEVVLQKFATGIYPTMIELDYVESVVDFEKRFEFLFTEGNSRIFLLGTFLKIIEISNEEKGDSALVIPVELDEVIHNIKNKSEFPDWLLVSMLALINVVGESRALKLIEAHKSNIDDLIGTLTEKESDLFLDSMLKYGHAINDQEFFYESKVL